MKKLFCALVILVAPVLLIATQFNVLDEFSSKSSPEGRVYVSYDDIYFSSNQIYLKIAADLISVQRVSCDENGIFVSIQDLQTGRAIGDTWICRNPDCGYENYVAVNRCGICGWSRYAE